MGPSFIIVLIIIRFSRKKVPENGRIFQRISPILPLKKRRSRQGGRHRIGPVYGNRIYLRQRIAFRIAITATPTSAKTAISIFP